MNLKCLKESLFIEIRPSPTVIAQIIRGGLVCNVETKYGSTFSKFLGKSEKESEICYIEVKASIRVPERSM